MDHVEFTDRRSLPMMALRGLTVFPGMMLTFEVERSMSIAALNMAMSDDQIIYLVPQIDIATDIPTPEDVYGVGTVCRIKQMMKQPGSKTVRVIAEGIERGRTLAVRTDTPCFVAEVEPMPDVAERKTARIEALIRHCCNLFDAYVTVSGNMAPESVITVLGSTNAGFVSNFIAQHVFLRPEQKQELLEQTRPSRRLTLLSKMLLHETSVLGLQHQLEEAAQDRLNQTQQEYLLREQMKIIQAELGEADDPDSESTAYREKIQALHLPEESEQRLLKEVDRLKKQPFGSSEASVIRNYLDDIYYLRSLLTRFDAFKVIREVDYIKNPKPSGYRSLHLVVNVPIVISEGTMVLPVEIQLRTIAMDMWASLEHELRYKSDRQFTDEDATRLRLCSDAISEIDQEMQDIYQDKQPRYQA